MSGVNCRRENFTFRQLASDFTERVLARPGTPSSSTWPLASNPITSRSTRYVWPMMTLPISLNSGRTNAPASCTASLIALIPVFMSLEILPSDGQKNQKMRSKGRSATNDRRPRLAISTCPTYFRRLQAVVVMNDHAPDRKQQQVIEAENHLIPGRPRPSYQLRQEVLGYQHQPDQPIGMRKYVALETSRNGMRPKPYQQGQETQYEQRAEYSPQDGVPIIFVSQVDVRPAFQPVLHREAQSQKQP